MASHPESDNVALFVCDLQERFKNAIYEFDKVVSTTQKMLKASQIFNFKIFITTQLKDKLGPTVPELQLDGEVHASRIAAVVDKSKFSMLVPEISSILDSNPTKATCILVGIEAHICITQTTLDLIAKGHKVYVLADGVSSCNKEEVPIALRRLAAAGAVVTTSESLLYQICGDASSLGFRALAGLIKETKDETRATMGALCKM